MISCHLKSCELYGNSLVPNPCDTCHIKTIECRYVTSYVAQAVKQAICLSGSSGLFARATDEGICSKCKVREAGELTPEEEISIISHDLRNYCSSRACRYELVGEMEKSKAVWEKLAYYYSKLLRIYSDDISLCIKQGEICVRLRKYEKAREYYSKAIEYYSKGWGDEPGKTDPQQKSKAIIISDLYVSLASTYNLEKEFDKAIHGYSRALEFNPQSSNAYITRARAYESKRAYDKAINDYSKAIEINPQYKTPYIYRAEMYKRKRDYNNAIKDYSQLVIISPDDSSKYSSRGSMYVKIKEYVKAIADYSAAIKAVKHNSMKAPYYLNRARLYITLHRHDDAIEDCFMAIEAAPDFAECYRIRSFAYRKIGRRDEALLDWDKYQAIKKKQLLDESELLNKMKDSLKERI